MAIHYKQIGSKLLSPDPIHSDSLNIELLLSSLMAHKASTATDLAVTSPMANLTLDSSSSSLDAVARVERLLPEECGVSQEGLE
jgi:hypothetical protein